MTIRLKRPVRRAFRAMADPRNVRSLCSTVLCLRGWARAKWGQPDASREVVLDLRYSRLCVDIARAEIVSFWEVVHERCYDPIALDYPVCVVDVGANIGAFSLYQAITKHAERVIAFEPSPQVFPRLLKNVELNGLGNVTAINAAVGDMAGLLSFSEGRMSMNGHVSESGPLKVPCVTLDGELRDIPRIDILKIDTEGYEAQVLRGASDVLTRTQRIAVELHYPSEREEIDSLVLSQGFVRPRSIIIWFFTVGRLVELQTLYHLLVAPQLAC